MSSISLDELSEVSVGKWKCVKCGYSGNRFVFQFNEYTYCIASNDEEPEFIDCCPKWVSDKALGDAEIGEPVGCPKCRVWGVNNFEIINRQNKVLASKSKKI